MYFKLSVRNARRCFSDYLLYITTMMTLMSVMEISQCIAISMELSGFQTASLPIVIGIIQMVLVSFIDRFILKQRTKEFASYLLLGMEKSKLTALFLLEFFLIGIFCFGTGTILGFVVYRLFHFPVPLSTEKSTLSLYGKSMIHCLFYFYLVEIVCAIYLKRYLDQLQIRDLICEKNSSQAMPSHTLAANEHPQNVNPWGIALGISFVLFITFVLGIVFLPGRYASALISVIAIPMLSFIYAFYRWLFQFLYIFRKKQPASLYQGSRIYLIAKLTTNFRTDALINTVFCICLLFSSMAFFTGMLMLQNDLILFDRSTQLWMGTAQVCLCIIFFVLYFFILSLRQIMEFKRSANDIPILHYIGKDKDQLQKLVNAQISIELTLPMLAMILIMLFCIPLINGKLNFILPETMHDIILKSSGCFFLCLLIFYFCFYGIVNVLSNKNSSSSNHYFNRTR